jgi:hypothetical protein
MRVIFLPIYINLFSDIQQYADLENNEIALQCIHLNFLVAETLTSVANVKNITMK